MKKVATFWAATWQKNQRHAWHTKLSEDLGYVTQIVCNMDFNYDILFDAFLAQVITTAYLNY